MVGSLFGCLKVNPSCPVVHFLEGLKEGGPSFSLQPIVTLQMNGFAHFSVLAYSLQNKSVPTLKVFILYVKIGCDIFTFICSMNFFVTSFLAF